MPGNHGIKNHQNPCSQHPHRVKQRVQTAVVTEGKIDVSGADASDYQPVPHLLHQKNYRHPHQLIIPGNGFYDLLERKPLPLRRRIHLPAFPYPQQGKQDKQRGKYGDNQRHSPVGCRGAASQSSGPGSEQRN